MRWWTCGSNRIHYPDSKPTSLLLFLNDTSYKKYRMMTKRNRYYMHIPRCHTTQFGLNKKNYHSNRWTDFQVNFSLLRKMIKYRVSGVFFSICMIDCCLTSSKHYFRCIQILTCCISWVRVRLNQRQLKFVLVYMYIYATSPIIIQY